jgi:hypothetical protein
MHAITPRTQLVVELGPHITNGAIRPELSFVLRRRLKEGELSLGYSRTQATTMGERGTIDVHRAAASGTYRPARRLSLTGAPAFARSARAGRYVRVYTLDFDVEVEATRRLSLVASGRIGRQEGTLADPREATPYRTFALKVTMTLPRRGGADAGWPSS